MPHLEAPLRRNLAARASWKQIDPEAHVSNDPLNVATWLRAAATMKTAPINSFNCQFCTLPCAGWGPHLLAACRKVALPVQAGFCAPVLAAAPVGAEPEWMTTAWVHLELRCGDRLNLVLRADHQVTATWPPVHPHTVYATWSGQLIATCAETLAIDCSPRWPSLRLPEGPSHLCPITKLGSVLVYVQWSCERVGTWAIMATCHVPVSSTAPIRPLVESPSLGVTALMGREFTMGSDGQRCSVLIVIGGGTHLPGEAPLCTARARRGWTPRQSMCTFGVEIDSGCLHRKA